VKVAVIGATGLIGRALSKTLIARGDGVVALSRGGAAGIAGAEDVAWDPAGGPLPSDALDGVDAVVNLAGVPIAGKRWTNSRKEAIRESRTRTTKLVVDALARDGAPRVLVSGSAVGYYGTGEEEVDETSPPGEDFLAQVALAWEREAARAHEFGVRVVMLRTGIVLARDGGALPELARPVKLYAGGPIGGGRQWMPWIHLDDEVGIILFALDHDEVSGALNGTAPDVVRQRDFVSTLARALGRPSSLPTPAIALRLAMGEMSILALEGQRAVPRATLAAGYEFTFPEVDLALFDVYKEP
jgi:uncharacterized protein (TIGR01777 family)